uniref:Reverse transcriptase domain, reverse transcriptase zinc-binding domain protein n=2 Tax=Tanacetum cinerariifolium TaxID=118510 RepID=A0A6L2JD77_TANCI|nr:reverse transcriptase domain, reverse transcriptase zinc-binding domain protein [Tanacetum cinerariifolium]
MASRTSYAAGCFPFTYLGLPIGANMNLTSSWQILIDRFQKRLSSWKANLLFIGGRLTLIKAVLGSLGIYYLSIFKAPETILNSMESHHSRFFCGGSQDSRNMAWVKCSQVLSSFEKRGLQIDSLKAFNLTLLQKWRWRLLSSPNNMWGNIIKALHGQEGVLNNQGCSFNGTWSRIIGTSNFLHSKGIIPLNSFCFKVGCSTHVRFWKDIWIGDSPLHTRYNRLYRLDQDKDCLIIDRIVNVRLILAWMKTRVLRYCLMMALFLLKVLDVSLIRSFSPPFRHRRCGINFFHERGHVPCDWVEWLKNPLLIAGSYGCNNDDIKAIDDIFGVSMVYAQPNRCSEVLNSNSCDLYECGRDCYLKHNGNGRCIESPGVAGKYSCSFYDDDDDNDYEESTNPLPPSILITTSLLILPIEDPKDSLIMRDEDLNTIPEKESDKVIKSSVEDLVPIPCESEDTSESDSAYDLSSYVISLPLVFQKENP